MTQTPTADDPLSMDGFVFVVTYGRSGSTLIQSLLNTRPGYCIRGENADALGPLARSWAQVTNNRNLTAMRADGLITPPDDPWYGGEGIDPASYGRELARLYVRDILRPPPGTRMAGNKEIRWGASVALQATILRFLTAYFPRVRFVFNTRNADQVARSAWWADEPEDQVKAQIAAWDAEYDAYVRQNPAQAVRVHYNDYVADHEALRPMFDLLGEDWDPDAVARVMARPLMHAKTA